MTPAILTIADIITPADAFILASGECSDWLNRPCGDAQPDEFARDCDAERARGIGGVEITQFHDPLIIEGAQRDHV